MEPEEKPVDSENVVAESNNEVVETVETVETIEELEEKKNNLIAEREKVKEESGKVSFLKRGTKTKALNRIKEIDAELTEIEEKIKELKEKQLAEIAKAEEEKEAAESAEKEVEKTAVKTSDKIEKIRDCLDQAILCKQCNKPFKPDYPDLNAQRSCASVLSLLKPNQGCTSRCTSHHHLQKGESKTCINCGHRYRPNNMAMTSQPKQSNCSFHKPQSRSCKFSMTNSQPSGRNNTHEYYKIDYNQEVPSTSRSKCSQLSQNHSFQSAKSLAPCQSFEYCNVCKNTIFTASPSCQSFDNCKTCKKSRNNPNHDSEPKVKAVRSVNFSVGDDATTGKSVSDDNLHGEKIIQTFNCNSDSNQDKEYCGCPTTLSCDDPCNDNADDGCGDEEDECDKLKRQLQECESFVPKEPSEISMIKAMLQEKTAVGSVEQLPEPKKKSIKIDPTKPKLHRTKKPKNEFDDFSCPLNPCGMSEETRLKYEQLTQKVIEREEARQQKLNNQKQVRLTRLLMEKCGDDDTCKTDTKCSEPSNDCTEYSKKYLKMKYEIELQNYLVEKLNRDLTKKISKNFPNVVLCELRKQLEKEVGKLRDMVEFTMFEQCRNRDLKWGPIPTSILTTNMNPKMIYKKMCNDLPRTPSGVSNISAFSMLEDLKLCQERERHHIDMEIQEYRHNNIAKISKEIESLECTMAKLKCEQLNLTKNIEQLDANKGQVYTSINERIDQFNDVKRKLEQVLTEIQSTKSEIDLMHTKIHLLKNPS